MIFSERMKLAEKVKQWFGEHDTDTYSVRRDEFGVICALEAMGYLKDKENEDMDNSVRKEDLW